MQKTSVIPTGASAEWRNLLRCRKVPPQGKICHLGRFLDSLRSLGMTCRGEAPFIQTGCIRNVAGRSEKWNYIGRGPSGRRGWLWRYKQAPKCRLFRCLGAGLLSFDVSEGSSQVAQKPCGGSKNAQQSEMVAVHQAQAKVLFGGGGDDLGVEGIGPDGF